METDSPIRMSTENMIVMPGQPRRDEGDMALKRPGVNRKTFPSVGVIPGEGKTVTKRQGMQRMLSFNIVFV
jgi:hypothetical protein